MNSITCEIRDNETGCKIAVETYETMPQIGWFIEVGEVVTPVKKILLKAYPVRQNAVFTDDHKVILYI